MEQYSMINTQTGNAWLRLYVTSILITEYNYSVAGMFLSERLTDTDISLSELVDNIGLISRFAADISNKLSPVILPVRPDYHEDLRTLASLNGCRVQLTINALDVIDATYRDTTGIATFKARPALTLTFKEFKVFLRALIHFLRDIQQSL